MAEIEWADPEHPAIVAPGVTRCIQWWTMEPRKLDRLFISMWGWVEWRYTQGDLELESSRQYLEFCQKLGAEYLLRAFGVHFVKDDLRKMIAARLAMGDAVADGELLEEMVQTLCRRYEVVDEHPPSDEGVVDAGLV